MVHFTQCGPARLFYSASAVRGSLPAGYPIRTSPDQRSCAPPRGFSQLVASFIAWQLLRHPPWTYVCLAISSFPPHDGSARRIRLSSSPRHGFLHAAFVLLPFSGSCQRSLVVYMGRDRVELSTPALSERCSNQLSYHPARHHAAGRQDIPHHAPLAHEPLCSTLCFFFLFPEKEVIQPHLPVRLPCYDFTPLTGHTLGSGPLAVSLPTSGIPGSDGVTGGVYKARERIHRAVLMRDY